jgi:hypothetical protein
MMIVRPEGFLPTRERKAELHGVGVAAEETSGTAVEVADEAAGILADSDQLDLGAPGADSTRQKP